MAVYRTIQVDTLDALRDVTVQAERAYLRLALGRFSTRTGIVKYNARDLAAEARLRPSELEAALVELERSGHILRADSAPAVYLLGFCSAFAPRSVDTRKSWVAEVRGCKYPNLQLQALEEIETGMTSGGPVVNHRVSSGGPVGGLQEQDQEQDQNRINSTPLPSVAAPTGARAAKESKKLATDDRAAQLIAEYTRLCPSMPKAPPSALKAATAALKREPDLDVWLARFARAEASDFLAGRKTDWRANILWLLGPINVGKLDAGQYDNHKPRNGPGPGMMRTPAGWMPEPERKPIEDEILY